MPLETLANRPNFDPKTFRGEDRSAQTLRQYFAAVTGVDEQFGRLLKTLDEEGLADNTIVVFTADHGDMLGSHGRIGKDVWHAESFRVPFIIRFPNRIAARQDNLLIGTPDLAPTLLGLAGESKRIPNEMQGVNYAPALLGEPQQRPASALYWTAGGTVGGGGTERRGLLTHTNTFVIERTRERTREQNGGRSEKEERIILHNDLNDPYQLDNTAEDESDLVETLRNELWERLQQIEDPWTL